jgi:hypothetical protein
MIKLKKINSFSIIKSKSNSLFNLSKNKLKSEKKVKFNTPVELRILTPNSISIKNRTFFNLNKTDKKSKSKPSLTPTKKITIKSIENEKTEKRPKSRFGISPLKKFQKRNSQSFVKYVQDYPKTFYQKIYNNIEKMKIKLDRTIKVMRRNLRLTNHDVFLRATNLVNINTLINRGLKLKKESLKKKENKKNNTNIEQELFEEQNKKNEDYIDSNSKNKQYNKRKIDNSLSEKKNLGLEKISLKPFYNIKLKPFYIPLFKSLENNNKYYKNMYHTRFSEMKDSTNTNEVSKKIYDAPYILQKVNIFLKQPEVQLKSIYNKLKLLLNNIQYFYNNFLIKREFRHAFINMENPVKAHFNMIIEEVCILVVKLIPLILKEFYFSLSQLLFINIPQINEEMEKTPSNEIECLKYNIHFFQKVKDYYSACVDIYNVIQKQIAEFKFSPNEFTALNNILDLARYNSSNLISMANTQIEKTKNDDDIFNNFEIGLNIKKKKYYEKESGFERFHKRRKIKLLDDKEKINRIKSALNIGTKDLHNQFIVKLNNKENENQSILNSYLIKDMMNYFTPEIKQKIISQQVIERFKKLELERLKFDPDNRRMNDGSSINIEENEN